MDATIHLCVTCVSKKTVNDGPRFRDFRQQDRAFERWVETIERDLQANDRQLQIRSLYEGPLWQLFTQAFDILPHNRRKLWVLSAGLGLVNCEDPAPALGYSATFTRGKPDSVENPRQWWNRLTDWQNPSFDHARSLHELYEGLEFDGILIIVCSAAYFGAVHDDLLQVRLRDRCNLVLAGSNSATKRIPHDLRQNALGLCFPGSNETAPGQIAVKVAQEVAQALTRP